MKELRMYGLVNYQLTGIQKGIQFLHGVVEYSQMANRIGGETLSIYNDWADNHKTVILLNGGTTNDRINLNGLPFGTLNQHVLKLKEMKIDFATFQEPDLGDQLTCISFIVDERIFNKKDYPDLDDFIKLNHLTLLSNNYTPQQAAEEIKNSEFPEDKKIYNKWLNLIGGEKNYQLREFLKNFRLA
jgi:hypothetical protein